MTMAELVGFLATAASVFAGSDSLADGMAMKKADVDENKLVEGGRRRK